MPYTSIPWRANVSPSVTGPRIALIHGLAVGKHMERNLLTFLRSAGYADTSLYSNHLPPQRIVDDLVQAAQAIGSLLLLAMGL